MKLKIIVGILVVLISFSFYILFTYYKHLPKKDYQVEHHNIESKKNNVEQEKSWLDFLLKKPSSYSYPATEMKLIVDFKKHGEASENPILIVNNLDDYKFFCLDEVLKQKKIEFAYSKTNDSLNMIIYLPKDTKIQHSLMNELKYYEIKYKLQ